MVTSFDADAVTVERLHGVLGERLVEHGEDFWGDVVDCYSNKSHQLRINWRQIFVDEVVQLCRELDSCWAAAHDGEV